MSQYLHHEPRDWDACWKARLARELCDTCSGAGCIIRQVSFGEIYEPCPGCKVREEGNG